MWHERAHARVIGRAMIAAAGRASRRCSSSSARRRSVSSSSSASAEGGLVGTAQFAPPSGGPLRVPGEWPLVRFRDSRGISVSRPARHRHRRADGGGVWSCVRGRVGVPRRWPGRPHGGRLGARPPRPLPRRPAPAVVAPRSARRGPTPPRGPLYVRDHPAWPARGRAQPRQLCAGWSTCGGCAGPPWPSPPRRTSVPGQARGETGRPVGTAGTVPDRHRCSSRSPLLCICWLWPGGVSRPPSAPAG